MLPAEEAELDSVWIRRNIFDGLLNENHKRVKVSILAWPNTDLQPSAKLRIGTSETKELGCRCSPTRPGPLRVLYAKAALAQREEGSDMPHLGL